MREYTVSAENITVANAAVTLVIVNPPTNYPLAFIRAWWGQSSNTTSAQQRIFVGSKASAFGTYTSATPKKLNTSDPSSQVTGGTAGAAGTAGTNASAEGAGTEVAIFPDVVNNLNGHLWVPSPQDILRFNQANSLGVILKLGAAPANTGGHNFGMNFAELA